MSPVTSYHVRIDRRGDIGNIMIGFATRISFDPNSENFRSSGWYISAHTGAVFSQDSDLRRKYTKPIQQGDIITAIFDPKQKEIRFSINNEDQGVAFVDVTEEELYPTIEIGLGVVSLI